ncbi:hypothetical protein [Paenibacillus taiwanensis]|nr:hypothetical protein [Paenibacillus taiwanensis]
MLIIRNDKFTPADQVKLTMWGLTQTALYHNGKETIGKANL